MYDYRNKNRPLSSSSHMNEISGVNATSKSYNGKETLKSDYLLKNKPLSRNGRISNSDSENVHNNNGGKSSSEILHSFGEHKNITTTNSMSGLSTTKAEDAFNSVRLAQYKRNRQSDKNINNKNSSR